LDQGGLINKIVDSAADIDNGRKWLDTDGLENKGRISYRLGLASAMEAFQDAQLLAAEDLAALILSEKAFITHELQFCVPSDTQTSSSLTQAIIGFDDALLSLQAAESGAYNIVDLTYPHNPKYRIKDMPKDSFHIACISHRTRIGNILRAPGINMAEKELLTQRQANLATAQAVYLEKQKSTLSNPSEQKA